MLAPRMTDVINASAFEMFPDSSAARGESGPDPAVSENAVAFAELLRGLHW